METQSREEIEIEIQRNMDFLNTFGSETGKRVLDYLSKFCLENRPTFRKDSERESSFNEGSRFVILEIRKWLNIDVSKLHIETNELKENL